MGMDMSAIEAGLYECEIRRSKLEGDIKKIAAIKGGTETITHRFSNSSANAYIKDMKMKRKDDSEIYLAPTESFYINSNILLIIASKKTFTKNEIDSIRELGYNVEIV